MSHSEDIPSLLHAASDQEYSGRFHEVYEVVSTVELIHNHRLYRIEILKSYTREDRRFSSYVYTREDFKSPWQQMEVGGVYGDCVDSAIGQTIGFLRSATHRKGS